MNKNNTTAVIGEPHFIKVDQFH